MSVANRSSVKAWKGVCLTDNQWQRVRLYCSQSQLVDLVVNAAVVRHLHSSNR
jgi:hypothetical protein